ncbi:YybS family protein [Martelella mediterranea]|uniref:DUF2232 domain-containing protein n=1 Tax=Martelella mediterranea TaxID=293089 RepID=UPI001E6075CD|nr:DUF2232 domain-containing protein [Martelella mediterranea]MCD1635280.1 YybS family protein [Martelella mediterranea]
MKTLNARTLLIGALSGVAAFALAYAAGVTVLFSTLLAAASALPILIAGLGYGLVPAIVGIVVAGALGLALASPFFALYTLAVTLIPAGWLSHLGNLARPASEIGGPDGQMAWYPLADIMMHLCAAVTLALIVVGAVAGYGPDTTGQVIDAVIDALNSENPELALEPVLIAQYKAMFAVLLPMVQGATSVILLFVAFHFASRIAIASGLSNRPREDVAVALRMNTNAIFVFLAALVVTFFFGGPIGLIGAACLGAFGGGFLLSGLARMHFAARGKSWAVPVIILSYLSLIFTFPALVFVVMGLLDTRRAIALSPGAPTNNDDDERNEPWT